MRRGLGPHVTETTPLLFEPMTLRGLRIPNRVWLAPMCQYSVTAQDGVPTDWHLTHLGARLAGGFGLVLTEATAVTPDGRISPEDTGLWDDAQVAAWRRVTDFARTQGTPVGVQLAHAGRKASTYAPWRGTGSVPLHEGGWGTIGPTAEPFAGYAAPRAMTTDDVAAVVQAFADATRRASDAGFDVVEIHAAHGYLLHEFLSPLVNTRTDAYGGDFEGRTRIVLETVDAVRAAWGDDRPVLLRVSASDWVEGGWTPAESARLAALAAERGVDLVDVSSGGAVADAPIETGPGYQVPFAREVRDAGVAVGAVGQITDPGQAEKILAEGSADAVLLARAGLREPSWPLRAAAELGLPREATPYPVQHAAGAWSTGR